MKRVLLMLVLGIFVSPANAATIVLSDTEFNDADWALTVLFTTGGSITASQAPNIGRPEAGNPGNYRDVINTGIVNPSTINMAALHINPLLTYDPTSQGAIDTIDFSIDYQNFSAGQAVQFALGQGSTTAFTSSVFVTTSSGTGAWNNFSLASLSSIDFPSIDFSSSAAPIAFGFRTANSGQIGTFEVGYDNFEVTVVNTVPIPGALWLLSSGLMCLIGIARRK